MDCVKYAVFMLLWPQKSQLFSYEGDFGVFPTLICSLSFLRSLHFLNYICLPMHGASPDKEEENERGIEHKEKERNRRASCWSYSLITCLPCKCSSKELHPWLQKTALLFQIIKYWPIKVRTWGQASSSLSLSAHHPPPPCVLTSLPSFLCLFSPSPIIPSPPPLGQLCLAWTAPALYLFVVIVPLRLKVPGLKPLSWEGLKVIKLAISYSHRSVRRGRGRRKGSGTSLQPCTWLLLSVIGLYRPSL